MAAEPASRSARRYLRMSVRGTIVLVLAVGGLLGWIVRSAAIQRDAVAASGRVRSSATTGSSRIAAPLAAAGLGPRNGS